MTTSTIPHPPIVSRDQWLTERKKLLAEEKALTEHYDRVNAERRRLPMVKLDKDYTFDGPNGKPSLKDLFEGRRQLIVRNKAEMAAAKGHAVLMKARSTA